MKHSITKKLIALFMCFTVVFTPLFGAAAADAKKYEQDCPYIYVHGFMGSEIMVDKNDPNSDCAWPPPTEKILDAVKKSLPSIAKLLVDGNYDKFSDTFMPIANDLLSDVMLSPEGTVNNKSGVIWQYPEKECITKDSELNFRYDWRIDPIEIAGQLNDFIDYVLDASGCDKVVLEGHSLGGLILNTYSKLYGNDKIRTYIFNTTAVYGETYNGELMTGQIKLNTEGLLHYLDAVMDYNEKEKLLDGVFKLLDTSGILDLACKLGNKLLDGLFARASQDVVVPLFGGWLTIWAMVPDDAIEQAQNFVFNEVYKNDSTDRSALIEKINNFNKLVRKDKTDTLKKINDECNLYVISRYGYSSLFMTPSWKILSDTVIDTKNTSFGATTAPFGNALPEEYIKSRNPKFISPDKSVDASTCMFPEQTWFVRNLLHAEEGVDSLCEMYKVLAYHDGQATVDTFEEYPQFLIYNDKADAIEIDDFEYKKLSFFEKIINFFKSIFDFIRDIFTK